MAAARAFHFASTPNALRLLPGLSRPADFKTIRKGIIMNLQRFRDSQPKYEYGCDLRRIYPWSEVASPVWGTAIASVRPNECTTPHSHNEFETFLVLSGQGRMTIE